MSMSSRGGHHAGTRNHQRAQRFEAERGGPLRAVPAIRAIIENG